MGFQRAGLSQPVLFCDIEPWSRQVLAKHWPDVPIAEDVKELASDPRRLVPNCDILSCGYPCQPFSQAGVRRGEEDDRHIWPEILPLLKQKGRVGLFAKMWLDTSVWASTKCYLTWKVKATPSNHLLFQLAPSMPRTDAIESGSLLHTPTAKANQMSPDMVKKGSGWGVPRQMMPTPTASDHIERNSTSSEAVNPLTGKSVSLDRFVRFWPDEETQQSGQPRMWATPTAAIAQGSSAGNPNREKAGRDLRQDVRMWPTPTANEDAAGTPTGKMQAMLDNHPDVRGTTPEEWAQGSLNPAWVEWLMGYPSGWTNLETSQE